MYKILLADDEPHIINYLLRQIPWDNYGIQVIGHALSGADAYSLALSHQIDILITDIRMPDMDGLSLCKRLLEQLPNLQIIIISAYSDFSYAKQALQIRALGYCLKPLEFDELDKLLHTAVQLLKTTNTIDMDELIDIIESKDSRKIQSAFRQFGLNCSNYYVGASIGMDDIHTALNAKLTLKTGTYKYLYFSDRPLNYSRAAQIVCYHKKNAGIAILPDSIEPQNLRYSIADSIAMAYQYFITGKPTLSDKLVQGPLTDDFFINLKKSFSSKSSLQSVILDLQTANTSMLFNIRTVYKFYNLVLHSQVLKNTIDLDEYFISGYEQLVYEYKTLQHLLECLMTLFHNTATIAPEPVTSVSSFMQIIKYLNENFSKDISLQSISETFHMNTSYLSYLIKKETGLTYSQYLTNLRINKAKNLLSHSQLTLTEICDTVGFHDYFYFIKKFKKITGITPGQYRKTL